MKRSICFLMVLCFVLLLCACGSKEQAASSSSQTAQSADNDQTVENEPIEEKESVQTIEIGSTIITSDYEITLEDVAIGGYFKEPEGYFTGGRRNRYDYGAGVFITIKNLQKKAIKIRNYGVSGSYCVAKIDYNDGYIYEAEELLTNGYNQSGLVELAPLDEAKLFFNIEISKDAYINRDFPLIVIIEMGDGTQYQYRVPEEKYW